LRRWSRPSPSPGSIPRRLVSRANRGGRNLAALGVLGGGELLDSGGEVGGQLLAGETKLADAGQGGVIIKATGLRVGGDGIELGTDLGLLGLELGDARLNALGQGGHGCLQRR
jgi:hypothetical protein